MLTRLKITQNKGPLLMQLRSQGLAQSKLLIEIHLLRHLHRPVQNQVWRSVWSSVYVTFSLSFV